jgi:hypothetical protein
LLHRYPATDGDDRAVVFRLSTYQEMIDLLELPGSGRNTQRVRLILTGDLPMSGPFRH